MRRTAEKISEMVIAQQMAIQSRLDRMDSDRNLVRLEEFDINNVEGMDVGTDFRSFTTNEPLTFLRKVSSILSDAQLLIQLPYNTMQEQERQRYDLAERFYYGILAHANERLTNRTELEIQDQMAGTVPVRGWGAVLALIRNRDDGTSFPDIRVWDARNVTWESDEDGLTWMCQTTTRTVSRIRSEYPKADFGIRKDDEVMTIHNVFDREHNQVVADDSIMLKDATQHGGTEVPGTILPVGPFPKLTMVDDVEGHDNNMEEDFGESIFAPNRKIYDFLNEVFSLLLQLTSKQVNQTFVHFTNDEGNEMEESPNTTDTTITLEREDRFEPLAYSETTKDVALLVNALTGMVQRGGLNNASYGDVQFSLSGYAITKLSAQERTVFFAVAKCMQSLMSRILQLIGNQFVTGRFNPMTLRGAGNNRDYMQITVTPEMIANLPPPVVKLLPDLPEDDAAKFAMAQQARSGPFGPLFSDRWIRDSLLKFPDAMHMQREIDEQMARLASPAAQSFTLARSSALQGEQELSQMHLTDLKVQRMMQLGQLLQVQAALQQATGQSGIPGGGGPTLPGGNGQAPGLEPEVSPFITQNGSPAPAPRNFGANRPPGAPRQGARQADGAPTNGAGLRDFGVLG